jgi:hypothetical protein
MRYRHEILSALAVAIPIALFTCLAWKILPSSFMDVIACILLGLLLVEVLCFCGLDMRRLSPPIIRRRRRSRFIILP